MEVNASLRRIKMKARSLQKINWINGSWISNNEVKLSINDRGVTLGDGIFETILIYQNTPQLLDAHLNRWRQSAKSLGMALPPQKEFLVPLINEAIQRISLPKGNGSLRLNWSRGHNTYRGINLPTGSIHTFWLELNEYEPCFQTLTARISSHEKRNANSLVSQHKTFSYIQAIQARHEAQIHGFDEALLLSTNNEMSCGATSNLLVKRKNIWLTPRLESGCLAGVMRQRGIDTGLFYEAEIRPEPRSGDNWLLINSLSCHSLAKVNTNFLKTYKEVELLWKSLLNSES